MSGRARGLLRALQMENWDKAEAIWNEPERALAGLEIKGPLGRTPLFFVVQRHSVLWVVRLLQAGARADVRDKYNETPLMYAMRLLTTPIDMIGHLARASPASVLNDTDTYGRPLLIMAMQRADAYEVVRALVEEGQDRLDLDATDREGHTALMLALSRPSIVRGIDIAVILLAHGARVDCLDRMQRSVLHHACIRRVRNDGRSVAGLELLLACPVRRERLSGIMNHQDMEGSTALHHAAAWASGDMLGRLVSLGASLEIRGPGMRTVVMMAAIFRNAAAMEYLVSAPGVDLWAQDAWGATALVYTVCDRIEAARESYDAFYRVLCLDMMIRVIPRHRRAELVNLSDHHGASLLMRARSKWYCRRVLWEKLFSYGADLEARDRQGKTLMEQVADRDEPLALRWLLSHGAQQGREEALWAAAVHGHLDAFRTMVELGGVDINAVNPQGHTVLSLMALHGHVEYPIYAYAREAHASVLFISSSALQEVEASAPEAHAVLQHVGKSQWLETTWRRLVHPEMATVVADNPMTQKALSSMPSVLVARWRNGQPLPTLVPPAATRCSARKRRQVDDRPPEFFAEVVHKVLTFDADRFRLFQELWGR